ncbi:MAG: GNAT family N-acetyltransferase [Geminicoccaceae bacterium]|nr:GNAT family N-acetyltransferase [Geminicoccaceae bacterium]
MIELRDAGPADADTVARLHTQSWQSAYRGILPDAYLDGELVPEKQAHWRQVLSRPPAGAVIILAEGPAGPVGFVAAYPEPDGGALIDNLHVLPGDRRGGTGRRLMAAVAARLRDAGVHAARLTVYEVNTPAVAFYRRVGGNLVGRDVETKAGVSAPVLEFVWHDLAALAARA